jgi:hypothetical protein
MTATERLRATLNELGVEWVGTDFAEPTEGHPTNTSLGSEHHNAVFIEYTDGSVLRLFDLTPEQAIAATLGDSVATLKRQSVDRVYLVEVSDELIESWCPIGVYLHKEMAEDCAEMFRREEDGVLQHARVVEMKVVGG